MPLPSCAVQVPLFNGELCAGGGTSVTKMLLKMLAWNTLTVGRTPGLRAISGHDEVQDHDLHQPQEQVAANFRIVSWTHQEGLQSSTTGCQCEIHDPGPNYIGSYLYVQVL